MISRRDEFQRSGFVVLPQILSPEMQLGVLTTLRTMTLAQLRQREALEKLSPPPAATEPFFGDWMHEADRLCHDAIRAVYESIFDTPALQRIFWCPALIEIIAELLDVSAEHLFLNSNRLRIDPPGPSPIRLGWHQESSYTRSRSRSLQFWGPLVWPSSEETGSIEIAPGSHANGHVPTSLANPNEQGARQYLLPQAVVDQYPTELVRIAPGDLVLFSCDLFHRSFDPSRQKRMKYSLVARYTDCSSDAFSPFGPL